MLFHGAECQVPTELALTSVFYLELDLPFRRGVYYVVAWLDLDVPEESA